MSLDPATLLAELRRRRVWQVGAGYGAAALATALAVAELYDDLGLPDGTPRMVIVVLVAGFPVALMLSWVFELRREQPIPADRGVSARPRVVVARAGIDLPQLEAVIVEDDTSLVLGAPPVAEEYELDEADLVAGSGQRKPALGSAMLRGGTPLQVSAVVHDLNRDPSWRSEWIEGALHDAFAQLAERGTSSVALEMLGVRHGDLLPKTFAELLRKTLDDNRLPSLRLLWILAPAAVDAVDLEPLTDLDIDIRL